MNLKKKNILLALSLLGLIALPLTSHATNFNYSHLEIGFTSNPGGLDSTGRFAFMEGAHVVANVASQFEGDWTASAGAGFHAPLNGFIDMYGEAQIYSVKFPEDDKHDWGELAYGITVGARTWLLPQLEAHIEVGQVAFDTDDTRSIVELGGRFHSTDILSIGATFRANGLYKQQFYMNVRFEF